MLKMGYLSQFIADIPDAAAHAVFRKSACADWHFGCKLRVACGMFSALPALSCFPCIVPAHRVGRFFAALRAPCPGLDVRAGMW